jgi:hypothetical protein
MPVVLPAVGARLQRTGLIEPLCASYPPRFMVLGSSIYTWQRLTAAAALVLMLKHKHKRKHMPHMASRQVPQGPVLAFAHIYKTALLLNLLNNSKL